MDLDFNVVLETFGFDPVLEEAAHAETEGASSKEALAAACAVGAELEEIVLAAPGEVAAATARSHARKSPSGGRWEVNPNTAKWATNLIARCAGWCEEQADYSARSSGAATQEELEEDMASARSAEYPVLWAPPSSVRFQH